MAAPTTEHVPDKIVIVGGGMAGIEAAGELRQRGYTGKVTLVDRGEFPYDRTPLSKAFLLGEADFDKIKIVPEAWFDDNKVELRTGRTAVRLRPSDGVVELDNGTELAAGAVLLSTGGDARPLPVRGGDHPRVRLLRTVEDSLALRELIVVGTRVVVVGGGLIGAEVASTALKLGAEVTLIEPLALPLEHAVGPQLAKILHEQHTAAGIRVLADSVAEIIDEGGKPTVLTHDDESIACDVVIVGIGMLAGTALAETAGLEVKGGVVVDGHQRTSNPAVYAAGDSARFRDPDGTLHVKEHWQAAKVSGRAAAAAMLGQPLPEREPEWFWSDRHGIHMEAVGTMNGPRHLIRGTPGTFPVTVFTLDESGHLLGAAAIGDPRMIGAARRLIQSGKVPNPDLLVDPTVNPHKLVRG